MTLPALIRLFFILSAPSYFFYVFPSGGFQPWHVFIVLSLPVTVFFIRESVKRLELSVVLIAGILFYCIVLNVPYVFFYNDLEFLQSSFQTSFALIIVIYFAVAFKNNIVTSDLTAKISFTALALSLIAYVGGLGRYEFEPRYNGFLNDPNQFAFFVLCFTLIGFSLEKKSRLKRMLILVFGIALLLASQSRSGIVGFLAAAAFLSISAMRLKRIIQLVPIFLVLLGFVSAFVLRLEGDSLDLFQRFASTQIEAELRNRGAFRPLEFPSEILFGAGKGFDHRFGYDAEVHSTPPAILFYYGITPFILFYFVYSYIFYHSDKYGRATLVAMFFYSASTYSFRTPIFWLTLMSVIFFMSSKKNYDAKVFSDRPGF